jgi:hypothetical protein
LTIVGFQIETKWIFSLVGIFINLRKCHLQIENLEKLIWAKTWLGFSKVAFENP